MVKVTPIPEELWGALNYVTGEIDDMLQEIDYLKGADHDSWTEFEAEKERLKTANDLVKEYTSCFGADGRVSQRGEIPQCWNEDTIFTPHRDVRPLERLSEQPILPFEENDHEQEG